MMKDECLTQRRRAAKKKKKYAMASLRLGVRKEKNI
jgi:hypothetical protein